MSRFLRKHRAYDQRTGRLERAIDLIEDGDQKGLKVHKREADQEHPLRRPIKIGPDRANLFPGLLGQRTTEDAQFRFQYGYTLGANLWEQRNVPVLAFAAGAVVLTGILAAELITSDSAASIGSFETLAFALTATETVTWAIISGADQAQFEISGSTLRWSGNGTKNFAVPADSDANNIYLVTVRATNAGGEVDTADLAITVIAAAEYSLVDETSGLSLNFMDATAVVKEP